VTSVTAIISARMGEASTGDAGMVRPDKDGNGPVWLGTPRLGEAQPTAHWKQWAEVGQ
jgi:hypothetical protein